MTTSLKILIVEDEFLIAVGLETKLIQEGFNVLGIVASGEKAIDVVQEQKPDLMLMDIRLAGKIDGIEAAAEIKKASSVPIIFMTGYSTPSSVERAEKLDPLGYLIKPVNIGNLLSIIYDM